MTHRDSLVFALFSLAASLVDHTSGHASGKVKRADNAEGRAYWCTPPRRRPQRRHRRPPAQPRMRILNYILGHRWIRLVTRHAVRTAADRRRARAGAGSARCNHSTRALAETLVMAFMKINCWPHGSPKKPSVVREVSTMRRDERWRRSCRDGTAATLLGKGIHGARHAGLSTLAAHAMVRLSEAAPRSRHLMFFQAASSVPAGDEACAQAFCPDRHACARSRHWNRSIRHTGRHPRLSPQH